MKNRKQLIQAAEQRIVDYKTLLEDNFKHKLNYPEWFLEDLRWGKNFNQTWLKQLVNESN